MKTIYRGKFIHNYFDDTNALLIHVDRTKPIWLFRNFFKKNVEIIKITRKEATEFLRKQYNGQLL